MPVPSCLRIEKPVADADWVTYFAVPQKSGIRVAPEALQSLEVLTAGCTLGSGGTSNWENDDKPSQNGPDRRCAEAAYDADPRHGDLPPYDDAVRGGT